MEELQGEVQAVRVEGEERWGGGSIGEGGDGGIDAHAVSPDATKAAPPANDSECSRVASALGQRTGQNVVLVDGGWSWPHGIGE